MMANKFLPSVHLGSNEGYDKILQMVLAEEPASEANLALIETALHSVMSPPNEAELDRMIGVLDGMRWPSETVIPDRNGFRDSIRWTLSQYPAAIGMQGLLIAVSKADLQVHDLKVTKECDGLMETMILPVQKYAERGRRQIEQKKQTVEWEAQREQQRKLEEQREAEVAGLRQTLRDREVRRLGKTHDMPFEQCETAMRVAASFGLKFDDTANTDWIPTGIRYLCHVDSRGVTVADRAICNIVKRDFAQLKLGCFLYHVDDQLYFAGATKNIDGLTRMLRQSTQ
jgi:hypothetical protein